MAKEKNIFSHKVVMGVLAFALAAGGYGGHTWSRSDVGALDNTKEIT